MFKVVVAIGLSIVCTSALAAPNYMCTVDVNGNGTIDTGEQQSCVVSGTNTLCPIQAQACTTTDGTSFTCPTNTSTPCVADTDGVMKCSINTCVDTTTIVPVTTTDPSTSGGTQNVQQGQTCNLNMSIMSGEPSRCRRSGTQTGWRNCCTDPGKRSIRDTMNSSGVKQNTYLKLVGAAANLSVNSGSSAAMSFLESSFDPGTIDTATMQVAILNSLVNMCDAEDTKTSIMNSSKYCVDIGTYCSESWPVVGCVQNDEAYCCFNSVLARIIHEQGRPQIPSMGGFGTPKAPNCRGFTIQEFESLDFSKIDFSEYADEIRTRTQAQMENIVDAMAHSKFNGP